MYYFLMKKQVKRRSSKVGRPKNSGLPSRALTEKEIVRLRAVLQGSSRNRERNLALVELALGTGCRINELCSLQIQDVMTRDKIKKEFVLGTTKNGSSHRVFMSKTAHKTLTQYLEYVFSRNPRTKKDSPLFPSQKNGFMSPSSGSRLIVGLLDKAGIDKAGGAHSLRKSFSKSLYKQSGGNLKLLQMCLNHRHLSSTSVYLSSSSVEVGEAVSQLRL
jgi:site-specific recombinase XerD